MQREQQLRVTCDLCISQVLELRAMLKQSSSHSLHTPSKTSSPASLAISLSPNKTISPHLSTPERHENLGRLQELLKGDGPPGLGHATQNDKNKTEPRAEPREHLAGSKDSTKDSEREQTIPSQPSTQRPVILSLSLFLSNVNSLSLSHTHAHLVVLAWS